MSVIGNVTIRACLDTTCYWHASHWSGYFPNGCYMLTDLKYCVENNKCYMPVEEGLKREGRDAKGSQQCS